MLWYSMVSNAAQDTWGIWAVCIWKGIGNIDFGVLGHPQAWLLSGTQRASPDLQFAAAAASQSVCKESGAGGFQEEDGE